MRLEEFNAHQKTLAREYFKSTLEKGFVVEEVTNSAQVELENQAVYLYVVNDQKNWLVHLDYAKWGRFIELESIDNTKIVVQLDDIYKLMLDAMLQQKVSSYAVKISRDADLYIQNEHEDNLIKKIQKSIKKRETGLPARLLFDQEISFKNINLY